jgi:hypothetical protein
MPSQRKSFQNHQYELRVVIDMTIRGYTVEFATRDYDQMFVAAATCTDGKRFGVRLEVGKQSSIDDRITKAHMLHDLHRQISDAK